MTYVKIVSVQSSVDYHFVVCSHEINLASTDSALTIIRHYQPNTAKKTDCVALKVTRTARVHSNNNIIMHSRLN